MHALSNKSELEIAALQDVMPPEFAGVEQSEEMIKWIWEHFAAVAGDQPSFECWRKYFSGRIQLAPHHKIRSRER